MLHIAKHGQTREIFREVIRKGAFICEVQQKMQAFHKRIQNFQVLIKQVMIRKFMKTQMLKVVLERELRELITAYSKPQLFPKRDKKYLEQMKNTLKRI